MTHSPHQEPAAERGRGDALGDEALLEILDAAIADERAAQDRYRSGLESCADPEACHLFEQLLSEEEAHERVLVRHYAEVKKRLGLRGAGRS